ncbi:MAG: hypothetical protein LBP61_06535 [Desulfovibrio sp.]|jgi:hypothetical protein|nr:hypothetical protein [Desulfovibrio sp.]
MTAFPPKIANPQNSNAIAINFRILFFLMIPSSLYAQQRLQYNTSFSLRIAPLFLFCGSSCLQVSKFATAFRAGLHHSRREKRACVNFAGLAALRHALPEHFTECATCI